MTTTALEKTDHPLLTLERLDAGVVVPPHLLRTRITRFRGCTRPPLQYRLGQTAVDCRKQTHGPGNSGCLTPRLRAVAQAIKKDSRTQFTPHGPHLCSGLFWRRATCNAAASGGRCLAAVMLPSFSIPIPVEHGTKPADRTAVIPLGLKSRAFGFNTLQSFNVCVAQANSYQFCVLLSILRRGKHKAIYVGLRIVCIYNRFVNTKNRKSTNNSENTTTI